MKSRLILTLALLLCWLPGHPVTCNYLEGEEENQVEVERGEEEVIAGEEAVEKARDAGPPAQLQYPLEGNVDADRQGKVQGEERVEEEEGAKGPADVVEEGDYEKLKVWGVRRVDGWVVWYVRGMG